jgi:hypothetical protein
MANYKVIRDGKTVARFQAANDLVAFRWADSGLNKKTQKGVMALIRLAGEGSEEELLADWNIVF